MFRVFVSWLVLGTRSGWGCRHRAVSFSRGINAVSRVYLSRFGCFI